VPKPSLKVVRPSLTEPRSVTAQQAISHFKENADLGDLGICEVLLPTEYCMRSTDYECSATFSDDEIDL
jgi:hypothetical protein